MGATIFSSIRNKKRAPNAAPAVIQIRIPLTGSNRMYCRKKKTFTRLLSPSKSEEMTMLSLIPKSKLIQGIKINDPPNPQDADTRKDTKMSVATISSMRYRKVCKSVTVFFGKKAVTHKYYGNLAETT